MLGRDCAVEASWIVAGVIEWNRNPDYDLASGALAALEVAQEVNFAARHLDDRVAGEESANAGRVLLGAPEG